MCDVQVKTSSYGMNTLSLKISFWKDSMLPHITVQFVRRSSTFIISRFIICFRPLFVKGRTSIPNLQKVLVSRLRLCIVQDIENFKRKKIRLCVMSGWSVGISPYVGVVEINWCTLFCGALFQAPNRLSLAMILFTYLCTFVLCCHEMVQTLLNKVFWSVDRSSSNEFLGCKGKFFSTQVWWLL